MEEENAAALICAALIFSELDLDDGFDEFDQGKKGYLSLQDLVQSCDELNLGLQEASVQALHAEMITKTKSGRIDLSAWKACLKNPPGLSQVLRSRGVQTTEEQEVEAAASLLRQALEHNELSIVEGFEQLCGDERDGNEAMMTKTDYLEAIKAFELNISDEIAHALFTYMAGIKRRSKGFARNDEEPPGITCEQWKVVLDDDETASVLKKVKKVIDEEPERLHEFSKLLAGLLKYNSFTPKEGFTHFDLDGDSFVSLADMTSSADQLEMDVRLQDLVAWHQKHADLVAWHQKHADLVAWHQKHAVEYKAFLTLEEWVGALHGIDGESAAAKVPDAEIEEAADMLAAALQYNNLPTEEGWTVLLEESDGRAVGMTLENLQEAIAQFGLEVLTPRP
ncbi:hypothetical protein T484DRAFT_1777000 [Baffinella frigidus]|nr:hypothetical protein T484DRAFT_1777000 [Cryptophyta sp. CCMP2293]